MELSGIFRNAQETMAHAWRQRRVLLPVTLGPLLLLAVLYWLLGETEVFAVVALLTGCAVLWLVMRLELLGPAAMLPPRHPADAARVYWRTALCFAAMVCGTLIAMWAILRGAAGAFRAIVGEQADAQKTELVATLPVVGLLLAAVLLIPFLALALPPLIEQRKDGFQAAWRGMQGQRGQLLLSCVIAANLGFFAALPLAVASGLMQRLMPLDSSVLDAIPVMAYGLLATMFAAIIVVRAYRNALSESVSCR